MPFEQHIVDLHSRGEVIELGNMNHAMICLIHRVSNTTQCIGHVIVLQPRSQNLICHAHLRIRSELCSDRGAGIEDK